MGDTTDVGGSARKPIRVDDARELEALLDSRETVLVEFYTEGCPKCRALEPVLGNVARATDVPVAMVNPRDDPRLIDEHVVRSVPTLILFRDGEEVDRLAEGFQGAAAVVEFVDRNAER